MMVATVTKTSWITLGGRGFFISALPAAKKHFLTAKYNVAADDELIIAEFR